MNFIVILATMSAIWHETCSLQPTERKGKFMGFSNEDMWGDILDEAYDPLPRPVNKFSVRDQILQKLQNTQTTDQQTETIPPISIPQQLVQSLASPPARPIIKNPITEEPPKPLILFDTSTQKFEVTPPGFASQEKPITEGVFLIGGQFEHQSEEPNVTEESLKLFWSSVGDYIESVPFLPIQVNVPDLIAAMAQFFAQRVPLVNRLTNPNKPRPNAKVPLIPETEFHYPDMPVETSLLEYRNIATPTTTARPKKNKKKKQNKRKPNRRPTTETYKVRGSLASTPRNSQVTKSWFIKSTELPAAKTTTEQAKLFHHNNNPGSEQVKYKNMPFIRKVTRYSDKELFNFKHSDISNSPIMILNMPSRPVFMYKFNHEQKTEFPLTDPNRFPKY